MDGCKWYDFAVRLVITLACLALCLIAATFSPCFIGANMISSTMFWRYFLIAVLLSLLPIATAPSTD